LIDGRESDGSDKLMTMARRGKGKCGHGWVLKYLFFGLIERESDGSDSGEE